MPRLAKAGTLTKDQVSTLEAMLKGDQTSTDSDPTSTASATGLSAILDEITAKKAATSGDTSATTTTAQTLQQNAASVMQSVYQAQQTNLFSLIG